MVRHGKVSGQQRAKRLHGKTPTHSVFQGLSRAK
jgi:hypothetical protein